MMTRLKGLLRCISLQTKHPNNVRTRLVHTPNMPLSKRSPGRDFRRIRFETCRAFDLYPYCTCVLFFDAPPCSPCLKINVSSIISSGGAIRPFFRCRRRSRLPAFLRALLRTLPNQHEVKSPWGGAASRSRAASINRE